jgi:hypothetical protein
MSLYDQVQQANTPFMSQFVGSAAPEIAQYSQLMQNRYNEAQGSDDALGEALGNLRHLGFDADTQYANELKDNAYKGLQERAASGDFENMGRRTRQDAIRFSQAYQPLMQRQNDFAEVVKKINSDDSIADPATKAALIQKAQFINTIPRNPDGSYQRDQNGRIQLGGIQDMIYAKDVDINAKIAAIASKKEADIKQDPFYAGNNALLVSKLSEVRSAKSMQDIARGVMETDPEVKAMLSRNADLQTYNLNPKEVAAHLKQFDVTPYEYLKKRGYNQKEMAIWQQANPTVDGNKSSVRERKASLMAQGYSEAAADKVILNNQLVSEAMTPYSDLAGQAYSVNKQKLVARTDELFLHNLTRREQLEDKDTPPLTIAQAALTPVDPESSKAITAGYTNATKELDRQGINLSSTILHTMKMLNMVSGNHGKDLALTQRIMNDPKLLSDMADKIKATDPDRSYNLKTMAVQYQAQKDQAAILKANTDQLEGLSKFDMNKEYQSYLKDYKAESTDKSLPKWLSPNNKALSLDEFKSTLRAQDKGIRNSLGNAFSDGGTSLNSAKSKYESAMGTAAEQQNKLGLRFHSYVPQAGDQKFARIAHSINEVSANGTLKVTNLMDPTKGQTTVAAALGLDPTNKDDLAKISDIKVYVNQEPSAIGKISLSATGNGKTIAVSADNLDPALQDEMMAQIYKSAGNTSSPTYAKSRYDDIKFTMGAKEAKFMSPIEASNMQPSTVRYPLNEHYKVQVIPGVNGGKRYRVYNVQYGTNKDIPVQTFESVSDMYGALAPTVR